MRLPIAWDFLGFPRISAWISAGFGLDLAWILVWILIWLDSGLV